MLESLGGNQAFQYRKLSQEEAKERGIIGRLVGVIADFAHPTRNGRLYSESLWDSLFNSDLMQERINNRCVFGELGHPTDREETDMEKIAICLAEVPKKKDGKLWGVFDILDSPNGRILKSLCDYGCSIGISSRGSGDLITDYDGKEAVDPDSYNCEGWDAVLLPAVKEARLEYVTESLNKKRYNKTLRDKLAEQLEKASADEKKVMCEALSNIGIQLDENNASKSERHQVTSLMKYIISKETSIDAKLDKIERYAGNDDNKWAQIDYKDSLYNKLIKIRHTIEDKVKPALQFDYIHIWPPMSNQLVAATGSGGEHLTLKELENLKTQIDNSLIDNSLVEAYNVMLDMKDGNGPDCVASFDSKEEALQYEMTMEVGEPNWETWVEEAQNITEATIPDTANILDSGYCKKEEWASTKETQINKFNNDGFTDVKCVLQPTDTPGLKMWVTYTLDNLNEEKYTRDELFDKFGTDNLDIINAGNEEDVQLAADDDGAINEQLQHIIEQNQILEKKVIELQEKLSVCYAKEASLNEANMRRSDTISKLSAESKKGKALTEKFDSLQLKFNENLNTLSKDRVKIKLLEDNSNNLTQTNKSLREDLHKKHSEIRHLNQKINTLKEELDSNKQKNLNKVQKMNEALEDAKKDLKQLKENYSIKLESNNQLVEKYKTIARNAVNKYIDSQATKLGISSKQIKSRLSESYTFKDIDNVCEELQEVSVNMNKLPFNTSNLKENIQVKANSNKQSFIPVNRDDDITEYDLKLAGLV